MQEKEQWYLQKIKDWDAAKHAISRWHLKAEKIVFTNGVFDVLHFGHVQYLAKAASLGHRLIIGVNTDASVKSLKGPNRPINILEHRLAVLGALSFVDMVVPFSELDPLNLILHLKPDVLAKGADYRIETIVGAKEVMSWGGEVATIEFVKGLSSTNILKQI